VGVRRRDRHYRDLGDHGTALPLLRYLAARHKHGNHDHHVPDGLHYLQNTQNRDARAINLKLDELIHAIDTAKNQMMDIEKLSDEELDVIHEKYTQMRADCVDDEGAAKA
jgi:Low affinity iron permease